MLFKKMFTSHATYVQQYNISRQSTSSIHAEERLKEDTKYWMRRWWMEDGDVKERVID